MLHVHDSNQGYFFRVTLAGNVTRQIRASVKPHKSWLISEIASENRWLFCYPKVILFVRGITFASCSEISDLAAEMSRMDGESVVFGPLFG